MWPQNVFKTVANRIKYIRPCIQNLMNKFDFEKKNSSRFSKRLMTFQKKNSYLKMPNEQVMDISTFSRNCTNFLAIFTYYVSFLFPFFWPLNVSFSIYKDTPNDQETNKIYHRFDNDRKKERKEISFGTYYVSYRISYTYDSYDVRASKNENSTMETYPQKWVLKNIPIEM